MVYGTSVGQGVELDTPERQLPWESYHDAPERRYVRSGAVHLLTFPDSLEGLGAPDCLFNYADGSIDSTRDADDRRANVACRNLVEPNPPRNFWWVYSYGSTQDSTLDPAVDRVADVFPDEQSITAAGWHSQEESELLAVLGPAPVGIPANNIAHFKTRQAGRRWSRWQAGVDAARAARRTRSTAAAGENWPGTPGDPR
ncbi:hypothetical protein VA596_47375 [Amycolatopsis sp., V23-08]|uniref:Gene product 88 domain-containing protein n=1 Tax=Amycolatopsis heterodermiae TaxID=3110235 RepID=A0ABU5RPH8_9PSEU|nr:hypothetical protein [Amycolatopsis sp., V23-08]MEA5367221.1 hypothetical protein [Amycolatopsis sp., V23-08]